MRYILLLLLISGCYSLQTYRSGDFVLYNNEPAEIKGYDGNGKYTIVLESDTNWRFHVNERELAQ